MNESLPDSDDQLSLKKRARRRLIGAIVFASFAAVVLPMVMDEEAPPATPSIELNIPPQEKGFVAPSTGAATAPAAAVAEPVPAPAAEPKVAAAEIKPAPVAPTPVPPPEVAPEAAKPVAESKPAARAAAAKAAETKAATKPVAKRETNAAKSEPAKPASEAKRAQAVLDGKTAEPATAAEGPHVVLIGAFANPGNVQTLQKKLGELGLKVYTEPLDSPQGKKTRVRAGPFPSREAAERAVARMKSIGVGGVVAPKS